MGIIEVAGAGMGGASIAAVKRVDTLSGTDQAVAVVATSSNVEGWEAWMCLSLCQNITKRWYPDWSPGFGLVKLAHLGLAILRDHNWPGRVRGGAFKRGRRYCVIEPALAALQLEGGRAADQRGSGCRL
jgi:hypothetical protein